jgi:hypothetical protein
MCIRFAGCILSRGFAEVAVDHILCPALSLRCPPSFFATIALIGCRHWPLFHHRMLSSFLAPLISLATSPPLHCVWGVAFEEGVSFGGADSLRCLAPLHPVSCLHVSGSLFSEVVWGGLLHIL